MSAVVADTHALIWFMGETTRLSLTAQAALQAAEDTQQPIYVPVIVIVELRYPVEKGAIQEADYQRILAALRDPSTVLVAHELNLDQAESVTQIPREIVPDMPDRIIAATALTLGLPLVTKDLKIRNLPNIATIW
ncbi:MAG: PIN domain-containing protein [Blastocatellia bacterium]|nr:PIN domain-containing protein [Blastocatellia bacterium]